MKFLLTFATVLAVSSAQVFGSFGRQQQRPFAPRPAPALRASASAVSVARASAGSDQTAETVRYESDSNPDGSYNYAVETNNGISAQAQGTPRDFGGNPPLVPVVAQGSFSWTSPEGQPIAISYIADENGYQPQGDALPVAPPVPPQIARALEWLARNAPQQRN